MRSETSALGAKTLLKKLISKIGNGLLISIGFTLGIGIIGLVYATYTWTTQTPVSSGAPLTSTIWNDMINNMLYLKENVDGVANKLGTQTEGKMCTSVGGKVTCTSDLPSVASLQSQIDTLKTQACPTGMTMGFINNGEDIYGGSTYGNTTDTCDGVTSSTYTCPTNVSKTCVDYIYIPAAPALSYYRTITCKMAAVCQ